MPNQLSGTGLVTSSQAELYSALSTAMQAIYGASIDLSSNSPDGQLLNLFIQSILDMEDLLAQIYNTFDPDNAIGVVLDQRVALNGIQREAGTFTVTNITIVNSTSVNLYGLDQTAQPIYTVSDASGNQWQLQISQVGLVAGSHVLAFQAATPGALTTIPNTITLPVTIVLGVTSINNPTTYTTLGTNEETDAALKVRRQMSVALPSQGYNAGLLAALENINGVTTAFVFENVTDTTDINGVPSHSIWVIVAGSGAAASIAQAIYVDRNAGCGMFGNISYTLTQPDGSPFTVYWSNATTELMFAEFTLTPLVATFPPNTSLIISTLLSSFSPGISAETNINALATAIQQIDSNALVTNAGFSLATTGPFTNTLVPTAKNFELVFAGFLISSIVTISPVTITLAPTGTQTFVGSGGTPAYTYSIAINESGGTINSSSGLYTAGAVAGYDTVLVVDNNGYAATAVVTVT